MIVVRKTRSGRKPEGLPYYHDWRVACPGVRFSLLDVWEDSLVTDLYVGQTCWQDMNAWVLASLAAQPVPETGGFCLGRYNYRSGRYLVSIEQFLPARQPAYQSPDRLNFGADIGGGIDDALQSDAGLGITAWFHTHPGHSPYLSGMDMRIHDGFFHAPYQLAIVLDPLTPDWDTGIFSRRSDGRTNNREHATSWISWQQLAEVSPI
ncbi:MAG: hypothetical protein OHK0039_26400 [Bacteroidia bacterium]